MFVNVGSRVTGIVRSDTLLIVVVRWQNYEGIDTSVTRDGKRI